MIPFFHPGWTFCLIAAGLILGWYAVIVPKLCPEKRPSKTLSSATRADEREEAEEESLLGASVLPEGVTEVAAHELQFVPRDAQLGLVPDVLEELKRIFHILETGNGTKQDFISLFRAVSAKYGRLAGTPSQRALNEYIREHALFPVSDEELANLWN